MVVSLSVSPLCLPTQVSIERSAPHLFMLTPTLLHSFMFNVLLRYVLILLDGLSLRVRLVGRLQYSLSACLLAGDKWFIVAGLMSGL